MKITSVEDGLMQIEKVFNPIILKAESGEEIILTMRDSGFEFMYNGQGFNSKWRAQKGTIEQVVTQHGEDQDNSGEIAHANKD